MYDVLTVARVYLSVSMFVRWCVYERASCFVCLFCKYEWRFIFYGCTNSKQDSI